MPPYHLNIAEYPVGSLVKIVSDLLESIIETNDKIQDTTVTHFHSRAAPNISVSSYLTRILKFTSFSNEVLLSILIYFDRIAVLKKSKYAVNSLTVHRLLITSIVVASKFTSDVFYPNARYAKVGGLPLCELNQLELEFLFLCNFDLYVKLEDMQAYGDQLLSHAHLKQQRTFSPNKEITSSYKILKRKRSITDIETKLIKKKSEDMMDKMLLTTEAAKSIILRKTIYNSYHQHYHLDTILYTQDC